MCTRLLADLGADVIKIERVGSGDFARTWDSVVKGLSSYFVWLNRNKRSVTLNLKTESGIAILRRLVTNADVFVQNFGPGVVERLGIDYAHMQEWNPRIVYCNISGYGREGPYGQARAYDLLVQGEAGIISLTGYPDKPAKVGVSVCDIGVGMYAALAVLAALHQRKVTGSGQELDISMFDCMLDWVAGPMYTYLYKGVKPKREGVRHAMIVPYGPFRAKDGEYVNVAVEHNDEWVRFCTKVLERPGLIHHPLYVTNEKRLTNRAELEPLLENIFASQDSDFWIERLQEAEVPFGRLNELDRVVDHPQLHHRKMMAEIGSPVGPLKLIASPLHMSGSAPRLESIPDVGQHTREVLAELGYAAEEIEQFRQHGII